QTLLAAWEIIGSAIPLRIAGDGPLAGDVERAAEANSAITWLRWQSADALRVEMQNARGVIVPSVWYEGAPITILESFGAATPVIASRIGSLPNLVDHQRTGLLFKPKDAAELARTVQDLAGDRDRARELGHNCRSEFERRYTADSHYRQIM